MIAAIKGSFCNILGDPLFSRLALFSSRLLGPQLIFFHNFSEIRFCRIFQRLSGSHLDDIRLRRFPSHECFLSAVEENTISRSSTEDRVAVLVDFARSWRSSTAQKYGHGLVVDIHGVGAHYLRTNVGFVDNMRSS